MRTIPFREVLWGVANKMGLDPQQSNFLENQAIPIGDSIDQWVRRTYDAKDWPEWVVTHKFQPLNHIVGWDHAALDLIVPLPTTGPPIVKLKRVLKVFLVDPNTTDAPVDTPFTLRDTGIHVGFEHGTAVWVRYMMPAPQFTAVQWDVAATYAQDDVIYSYRSGEVYRSKVNGNIGHDPATNFSPPPAPVVEVTPVPPPTTEITQDFTHGSSGGTVLNKIVRISLIGCVPSDPPDPPLHFTTFEIQITDQNNATIAGGSVAHVATGSESLAAIVANLAAQLVSGLGGGWTVTSDGPTQSITIQNASNFQISATPGSYTRWTAPSGVPVSRWNVVVVQPYNPGITASSGQPQITRTTITDTTTYPGSTYQMTVIDGTGLEHTVEYVSHTYDGPPQILQGLMDAVSASTDTYWAGVELTFAPTGVTLDMAISDSFSTQHTVTLAGSPWWELVPFPRELADQVMRGGYADLLKEWGQTDKGTAEEGNVPNEAGISSAQFTTMPDPPLTGQQRGVSRYKMEA